MKILITGATGFIGKAFVKELLSKKKEYSVFCAVRSSSKKDDLEEFDVNFVNFDLDDIKTFESSVKGKDIVVHFAAHYDFHAQRDILFNRNVEASKVLAEVCVKNEVKHFVYCSTTEVLGTKVDATEEADYNPVYVYGESKVEAEKTLLMLHKERGLPLTIARPTGVIGPGECYPFNDFIIAIDKGITFLPRLIPGSGNGTIHWTYIDDVVQGLIKIIENREKSIGQIFHLTSNTPQTWNEMIEVICESLDITGKKNHGRKFHIPVTLARIGMPLFTLYYKLRGIDNFVLKPGAVKTLQTSRGYINAKAKAILGFNPTVDFKTGVTNSVMWLRKQGRLKS